ncbi:sigma-54-dependent transcriptional regulator [Rubinisphaera italica]|uniref:Luminescence regulatory protein LuxO n=1 Tax=Rubinisphaera italica TaxID=2527969 RepID=A0A5C5XJT7_9PLAN|nr:sigma 54-interacting transcriptional regulator [Rubinisphaera italica]TWT62385.1 Luminescence regulatory protein LuxO [Rubinisphaera italica]
MPELSQNDLRLLSILSNLTYCNPFEPERIEFERAALREKFVPEDEIAWSRTTQWLEADRPNVVSLTEAANQLVDRIRAALLDGHELNDETARHYEDAVTYVLYYRYFASLVGSQESVSSRQVKKNWNSFRTDFDYYLELPGRPGLHSQSPGHMFACLDQVRRAFRHIFHFILGESQPAAQLRAEVWQSIFTHNMRRYRRTLFAKMSDVATLITGPSGTGKELVARAIGLSQYVAFDTDRETFAGKVDDSFIALNLSALSPTLIESELFGHRKGAFTGAISDRAGWLEKCPPWGAVFLDEIGELDLAIQVKLLRVVQSRAYTRLGETEERPFLGKLITATNRDLGEEMEAGQFRRDLYYRLCADHIQTPSLHEQLTDRPQALSGLIQLLAQRIAGEEADSIAEEAEQWINNSMPTNYTWPGNIRELEQCVRNLMIRNCYQPYQTSKKEESTPVHLAWLKAAEKRQWTAEELVSKYVTWVYAAEGTYEGTANLVGLDRRTVKSKIDEELLKAIEAGN